MNKWLDKIGLMKYNYKNNKIPAGAGILFVIITSINWLILIIWNIGERSVLEKLIYLSVIVGLTGLVDDILGKGDIKGLKGHITSSLKGKITTGSLKMLFFMTAVFLVVESENTNFINSFINLSLILLMTNIFNLFDLRPGRVIKIFLMLSIFLFTFFNIFIYFSIIFIIRVKRENYVRRCRF